MECRKYLHFRKIREKYNLKQNWTKEEYWESLKKLHQDDSNNDIKQKEMGKI